MLTSFRRPLFLASASILAALFLGARPASAETKYALCVGLNQYDTSAWRNEGWNISSLSGCVNDANYFYTNLVTRGGWSRENMTKLLDSGATETAIRRAISNYAALAVSGDTFVYQHSSHGGQISGKSVCLCSYASEYMDTELAKDLASFRTGVKVIVIVDACHSAGLYKGLAPSEFNLAGRVTEIMDDTRARMLARGVKGVTQKLASSEIGWATAAEYTESSMDGGFYGSSNWMTRPTMSGSAQGGVFLASFTWGWWNGTADVKQGYGDNDGYADAYECWKIAYDMCTNYGTFMCAQYSNYYSSEDNFHPQCTNVSVLRSVELGWVGSSAPTVRPAFSSSTSSTSIVQNTTLVFDFASLLTAGTQPVTYRLNAGAPYDSFSGGVLTFTPSSAGSYSFQCIASNNYGTATHTLTVTATQPLPATPAGLALSNVGTASFTASWSPAADATSYSLDVAAVSGGTGPVVEEDFSADMGWTSAGSGYTSGTHTNANGVWTYGNAIIYPSSAANAPGSAGSIQLQKAAYFCFPPVDNPSSVSVKAKGSGSGTMILERQSGTDWISVAAKTITSTVANHEIPVSGAAPATVFRISSPDRALTLYDVTVSGAAPSYDSLPGYPKTVSATSFSVTNLSSSTAYAARVRAVNSAGSSAWSAWVSATTAAGNSAPVWSAFPAPSLQVGGELVFSPADYLSGHPAPAVVLVSSSASAQDYEFDDGLLIFQPSAAGDFTFAFRASNSLGTASATLTATVSDWTETKYALCVGINEYEDLNSLVGCVNDANYFYSNLVARGGWQTSHMTKLTDAGATKNAIRSAISNFAAQAVSGDVFVYQQSSHGGQFYDTGGDPLTGETGKATFLCVYDEDYYDNTTAYNDYEMAVDLASFRSGVKVVVIVDACHSAGLFKGSNTRAREAAAAFDLAGRVTSLMNENRARRIARGDRSVARTLSPSEIGWATACEYYETSLDGGFFHTDEWLTDALYGEDYWVETNAATGDGYYNYPSSYKLGGVFSTSATWGWWNGTGDTDAEAGDNDGYCDAYEFWKKGFDFCSVVGEFWWGEAEDNFFPQCTNIAVLKSVELGWVGATAPSIAAPSFPSASVSANGVQNEMMTYTFAAAGFPAPAYSLSTTVSPSLWEFENGLLTFQPEATGDYTFTCIASNSFGTATCTLDVTVSPAPVTVPSLTVSDVTDTSALASWTACDGVSSYTLQLASDNQFTSGGSGGTVTLFTNNATAPASAPAGWTYTIANTSGSYLQLTDSGHSVVSEAVDASACTALTLSLKARTYGGAAAGTTNLLVQYSTDNGVNWTDIGTVSAANSILTGKSLDVSAAAGNSSVRFRLSVPGAAASKGLGISAIVLAGTESAGSGSLISTVSVPETAHTFTNLSPATAYYARVKGNSDWSSVVGFTTASASVPTYDDWLADNGISASTLPSATNSVSGQTYQWHFIADIPPSSTNELAIVFPDVSSSASDFSIQAASPNRFYQFVYSTNLLSGFVTSNIGWGVEGMTVSFPSSSNWYGNIRVLLTEP